MTNDTLVEAQLVKPAKTAARMCVTTRTLQRWRTLGIGPDFVLLPSGEVRYVDSSIEQHLKQGLVRHVAA